VNAVMFEIKPNVVTCIDLRETVINIISKVIIIIIIARHFI